MIKEYVNSKGKKFTGYLITNPKVTNSLPYILVVPDDIKDGKQIVMESLNFEQTNDMIDIAEHIIRDLQGKLELIDDAPYLIPFLPDVKGGRPYYQQLSRECFEQSENGEYIIVYDRIDLQVINSLEDAKKLIQENHNKKVDDKVFLNGYSSSGVFAQRFALIHPELIDTALIGGAAGSIPLPTEDFEYPLGIKDFKELFEKDFNKEAYKKIQFAYYVAEFEADKPAYEFDINGNKILRDANGNKLDAKQVAPPMHDMSYHLRSTPLDIGKEQRQEIGEDLSLRYKSCIQYYEDNGYEISSKIYKGSRHGNIYLNENPSRYGVIKDILALYKYGQPFKYDEYSASEISMKEQRKREGLGSKER